MSEINKMVHCSNNDCSKRHTCMRYNSRPVGDQPRARYSETWNGKDCIKFIELKKVNVIPTTSTSYTDSDYEFREFLVKVANEELEKLEKFPDAYADIVTAIVEAFMPIIKNRTAPKPYRGR